MKNILIVSLLAAAPALWAAEPDSATPPVFIAPSVTATNALTAQQELAEQAALVQKIGEDAARGFDAEAHARFLRAQIEALASSRPAAEKPADAADAANPASAPANAPKLPNAPAPRKEPARMASAAGSAAAAPETGIRQAIEKVRAALNELESKVNRRDANP